MRRYIRFLGVLLVAAGAASAQGGEAAESAGTFHRERIEWCDIWIADANEDTSPRVLLIGDSITRGYYGGVAGELEGEASCARLTTSRSVCDPVFFLELELVLAQYAFDVILFNNGLHGWAYGEEEYAEGFANLIAVLERVQPEAALICALSTPVLEESSMGEHVDRVRERNSIATQLCREADIPTNDLYALVQDNMDWFNGDGVHFGVDGREEQARVVASRVQALLP